MHVGLGDQRLAERGVANHLQLAAVDGAAEFLPRRRTVERGARLEPEQDADAAGGGLRTDVGAGGVLGLDEVDHPLVQIGSTVALGQPEADRDDRCAD